MNRRFGFTTSSALMGTPFSTAEVQLIRNLTGRGIDMNERSVSGQNASIVIRREE